MLTKYALIVLASFLVSGLAVCLLKKYALKHNLLISQGVPAVGGIALGAAFYSVCGTAFIYSRGLSFPTAGILISSLAMLTIGMVDDRKELSVAAKFLTQLFCVLVLILFGVKMQIAGLGSIVNLGLTIIWVLGITNAFNHLDVMDGVAAGVAVIVTGGLGVICFLNAAWAIGSPTTAFWPADMNMLLLLLPLMGVTLGFLIFNLPPANDSPVLPLVYQVLSDPVLSRIRSLGWYGIGGVDVLLDQRDRFYVIDGNFRVTAATTFSLYLKNEGITSPLISFTGIFPGSLAQFKQTIVPLARPGKQRELLITSLTRSRQEVRFNAGVFFASEVELAERLERLKKLGVKAAILEKYESLSSLRNVFTNGGAI